MQTALAIDGGPPALPHGAPTWPLPDNEVRAAVEAALADGSWGRYEGPHLERLVALLRQIHQVPFAYPCCSGTVAVELALRGLQIGAGDEVLLAAYDFPGNFRCIEATGARPVLVDVAASTWCLDAGRLEAAIGPQTRAVIVSHLHSGIADMRQICDVAARHELAVVEDACQSPAARVQGRCAGTWGDVGVLSFGGSKLLTAGRGGALLTRREEVFQRTKIFCERGNHAFPLSELQAAVLPPQLARLAERNQQRRSGAGRLLARLRDCAALCPVDANPPDCAPSYYKLAWLYRPEACRGATRERFVAALRAEGVAMDAGFRGFLKRGDRRCRQAGPLPQSGLAAAGAVLLHHPVLLETEETIDVAAEAIKKVVRRIDSAAG